MILKAGTLIAVAGAMQATVPVTRVAPTVMRPPNAAIAPHTAISANLLPDLVVSEVRIEGDYTAHIRITNQGSANAKGVIRVDSTVSKGYHVGITAPAFIVDLAAGESKWATASNYSDPHESFVPGKDMRMPLSGLTGFSAVVDPRAPPQSTEDYLLHGKSPCTATAGCIRELDETNNSRQFTPDELGHGTAD